MKTNQRSDKSKCQNGRNIQRSEKGGDDKNTIPRSNSMIKESRNEEQPNVRQNKITRGQMENDENKLRLYRE